MISTARRPRGIVKVNGEVIKGWESWEIDNNSYYQADSFRVTFALSSLPPERKAAWWSAQSSITIEILAGFPNDPENFSESELTSLIYGRADDVTIDFVATKIEASGRDMSSVFIDAKTTEKFQNLTASQIVTTLAQRRGLMAVVSSTSIKAGKYYEIDHARLTSEQSEWDLLTWLAHEENFVVYMKGKELHFEPKPGANSTPYVLQWEPQTGNNGHPVFNGKTLSFSHNLTLAKDVIVTVKSWNAKTGKAISKTIRATHNKNTVLAGAAQPTGDAQTYSYTIPGLTPEQALQKAQSLLREITQHEVKLSATMPADNILSVTSVIKVNGTGTNFDQIYYPDSIIRSMSITEGYGMSISAKNHQDISEVTL